MRALLDVNVLLALFDRGHPFHVRARAWWLANHDAGWASCPLSQNGFLRISCQKSYPRPIALADSIRLLRSWAVPPRHEFWPDDMTLLDPAVIDHGRVLSAKQLTDIYLLALAVEHGGRLATFDRGIPLAAARGARPDHLVVV
jgi:toxin-antitoxin system PIN domain toxin